MDLIVLTPEKKIFEGKVNMISVPGSDGEFEVHENHSPVVSALGNGKVVFSVVEDRSNVKLSIQTGFIEVLDNKVSLLIQEAKS